MFGFSAFERNKADLEEIGVDNYNKTKHREFMDTLVSNGMEAVSARKLFRSEPVGFWTYGVNGFGEEHDAKAQKYCQLLSSHVGRDIVLEPLVLLSGMNDPTDDVVYTLALAKTPAPK